jgi:hypothetical protein
MRASDADRERVVERLSQAAAEGRLLAHELEERLSVALCARTYGELDATVADLPSSSVPTASRGVRSLSLARSHPAAALVVAACAALALLMLAAVAVAAFFAFGGIWLILAVVLFARRGRWSAGYGRYGRGRYHRGWI